MEKKKINSVTGHVVSTKMNKTVTVEVVRSVKHPRFGKFIKKKGKFKAHDEKNQAELGDKVLIYETRPISKTKCWRMAKVLVKGATLVQGDIK